MLRGDGNADMRSEALSTLARLASLRPETLELLRTLLADVSAGVRAQACQLLAKHGVATTSAEITEGGSVSNFYTVAQAARTALDEVQKS